MKRRRKIDYDAIARLERELNVPLSSRPDEDLNQEVVWDTTSGQYHVYCGCGFRSLGWPDQPSAQTRGEAHFYEHVTREIPPAV